MSEEQERLYETVLHAAKRNSTTSGKNERLNALTALLKLRQVYPSWVTERNAIRYVY